MGVLLENMGRKVQEEQVGQFNKQVEAFHQAIPEYVPDWSDDIAQANREFALKGGLPEQLVDSMVDPAVVAFVDKFRRLAETTSKGAKKRKKAPIKRVSAKKPVSKSTKKSNRFMSFFKGISFISFNTGMNIESGKKPNMSYKIK